MRQKYTMLSTDDHFFLNNLKGKGQWEHSELIQWSFPLSVHTFHCGLAKFCLDWNKTMFAFSTSLVSMKIFSLYLTKHTKHFPDDPEAYTSMNQILGPQDNWGGKGPQEVSSPTFCFKAGLALKSDQAAQGFIQSGLENLQEQDCTTTLGSLLQLITVPPWKGFSLCPVVLSLAGIN